MKQYRLPTENMLPEYASIVWFMKYTSLSGAIAYEPEVVYIIYEPLPGSLNVEPWSGSGTAAPILVHMSMNHPNGSYFGTFGQNFLNQSLVQKFWFIFEPAQRFVFWHVDWHQYWFVSEPIFLTVYTNRRTCTCLTAVIKLSYKINLIKSFECQLLRLQTTVHRKEARLLARIIPL